MARRTVTAPAVVVTFLASSTLVDLLNNLARTGVRFTSLTRVQGSTYSAVAVRLLDARENDGARTALTVQLEMERNSTRCSYFMGDVAAERVTKADSAAQEDFAGEAAHEAACELAAAEYMESRHGGDDPSEDNEWCDGEYEVDAERVAEQRISGYIYRT